MKLLSSCHMIHRFRDTQSKSVDINVGILNRRLSKLVHTGVGVLAEGQETRTQQNNCRADNVIFSHLILASLMAAKVQST